MPLIGEFENVRGSENLNFSSFDMITRLSHDLESYVHAQCSANYESMINLPSLSTTQQSIFAIV